MATMAKLNIKLNLFISEDMDKGIRDMADMDKRSVSYIVREAVAEYMSRHTPPAEVVMVDDSDDDSELDTVIDFGKTYSDQ